MSNELTIPNLADAIRDRVRSSIVSVIPDEQIDKLVKSEFDSFFKIPERPHWSSDAGKGSPFQEAVKREIDVFVKEKVQAEVQDQLNAFTQATWDDAGKSFVAQFVKEYAPYALEGVAAAMVTSAMNNLRNNPDNY